MFIRGDFSLCLLPLSLSLTEVKKRRLLLSPRPSFHEMSTNFLFKLTSLFDWNGGRAKLDGAPRKLLDLRLHGSHHRYPFLSPFLGQCELIVFTDTTHRSDTPLGWLLLAPPSCLLKVFALAGERQFGERLELYMCFQ